jgi:K+-transporting ATPase ATPase B chain
METAKLRKRTPVTALTDPKIVVPAIGSAFAKLDPRVMMKNPVMFVVEVVAALTTVIFLREWMNGGGEHLGFTFQIIVWLWFTVLFANFAEAVAEGRGKAQAASLRQPREDTKAKLIVDEKTGLMINALKMIADIWRWRTWSARRALSGAAYRSPRRFCRRLASPAWTG